MKKKVAVIGYGGMGAGFHCVNIRNSDIVELAGIYDINPEKCKLAEEAGIRAYSSREELLADPEVEIVVVATPNDTHEEIAVAALNAGKNVISEKPVTTSLESLERMIAAANANKKVFSVHQNRRFDVDMLAVKRIVDNREIGDPINLESRVHSSHGIPGDWRCFKQYGGGMLYDWGIHIVDQACVIFGYDIKSVQCEFDHITNDEVDDGFKLNLEFKSGVKALLEVGTYNFIELPRFYLRGTEGTALIRRWESPAEIVKCKIWKDKDVVPEMYGSGLTRTMATRNRVTVESYETPAMTSDVFDYYRNFVKACDGIEEQLVTHDQMRCVLRIIMSAFESVEKGGQKIFW